MVRTLPFDPESRVNAGRVLAFFTAIAIHVLALLMLLMPLAAPPPVQYIRPPTILQFHSKPKPVEVVPVTAQPAVLPRTPQPQTPVQRVRTETPPQLVTPVIVEGGSQAVTVVDSGMAPDNADIGTGATTGPIASSYLQYVTAPPPPYPRDALRLGAQGTVILRVLVDTDGRPLEVNIEKSSGNKSLDREAQRHVLKRWKFQPAMRDGSAVQAYGLVPIDFSLQ